MLLETMSKEQVINLFKDHLLKCNQNINKHGIHFTKGDCYLYEQNEGGNWVKDDNDKWFDLCEIEERFGISDMAFSRL